MEIMLELSQNRFAFTIKMKPKKKIFIRKLEWIHTSHVDRNRFTIRIQNCGIAISIENETKQRLRESFIEMKNDLQLNSIHIRKISTAENENMKKAQFGAQCTITDKHKFAVAGALLLQWHV